jgi:hypothetical protein
MPWATQTALEGRKDAEGVDRLQSRLVILGPLFDNDKHRLERRDE